MSRLERRIFTANVQNLHISLKSHSKTVHAAH
jgi:hypothetical protein